MAASVIGAPTVAFLSMDCLDDFVCYDELAATALRERGVAVETVPWHRDDIDWGRYRLVVVRSTWDYQQAPDAFLQRLAEIDASTARLLNPLATLRANLDKRYLLELATHGVTIVPTREHEHFDADVIEAAFAAWDCAELIIKPAVSANADNTHRLSRSPGPALQRELAAVFGSRRFLLQPFADSVLVDGEMSLFHFNREYSHAIRKRPAAGDFRVQEEHGGRITPLDPSPTLRAAAQRVLDGLPGELLYARTDFIRYGGDWCLMEAELIEPSLYFDQDPGAAARFADAVSAALSAQPGAEPASDMTSR